MNQGGSVVSRSFLRTCLKSRCTRHDRTVSLGFFCFGSKSLYLVYGDGAAVILTFDHWMAATRRSKCFHLSAPALFLDFFDLIAMLLAYRTWLSEANRSRSIFQLFVKPVVDILPIQNHLGDDALGGRGFHFRRVRIGAAAAEAPRGRSCGTSSDRRQARPAVRYVLGRIRTLFSRVLLLFCSSGTFSQLEVISDS